MSSPAKRVAGYTVWFESSAVRMILYGIMFVPEKARYPDECDHETFLVEQGVYENEADAIEICEKLKKSLEEERAKAYKKHVDSYPEYNPGMEENIQYVWRSILSLDFEGEYRVVEIKMH